jgi:hypothetical protein
MQYALLIYEKPGDFEKRHEAEDEAFWAPWRAYQQALIEAGVQIGGEPLKPETTATVVRIRGGQREVQDGPYADTKEQLGGFILLELPSLDAALEWAARCPAARYGAVEVRPVDDLRLVFAAASLAERHGG